MRDSTSRPDSPGRRPARHPARAVPLLLLALAACSSDGTDAAPAGDSARTAGGDVAAAGAADSAQGGQPACAGACAGDDAGLTLPAGFCASLFAEGLGGPRHVAVRQNGDVFVARRSAPSGEGGVVALRDADGDGRAEVREHFGPTGGTGIEVRDGYLYLDQGRSILRYRLGPTELRPSGAPDTIVTDLPTGGHAAHPFAIDGRGNLFVNVGSRSNSCQQADRQSRSPGHDPCTELETRAGIWRFDVNRTGQRFTAQQRYATGIRNAVAIEVAPDGQLWAAQHGRDQLAQNWGFSNERSADNPAEELLLVNQGDDFGWPYCYYSNEHRRRVTAPEYGGDGSSAERCGRFKAPVAVYPGHWAPMSLLFYTGSQLPARYRDGVFIAFHGSWNRAPLPQAGFNVVFQPLRGGRSAGQYEVFADGFAGGTVMGRGGAKNRPAGLAQAADGSILVADDQGGRIYRIAYTGGRLLPGTSVAVECRLRHRTP